MEAPKPPSPTAAIVRDALLVAALSAALALATNFVRSDGLPLVAEAEYEILVPCPEAMGEAIALAPDDPALADEGTYLLDAGTPDEFAEWHLPRARSAPFDYLEPTPLEKAAVRDLLRENPRRIVVYGDGDDPDSGATMAALLAGQGLRNVHYVRGGRPALRRLVAGGAR